MKILMVSDSYYPRIGGVETFARNLAEGMAKNHSVTVVTAGGDGVAPMEVLGGVRIRRLNTPGRAAFSFAAFPAILEESATSDVIHALTPNGALSAWAASRLMGKKCMITVHEVWSGNSERYSRLSPVGRLGNRAFEGLVYSVPFDFYACVSRSTLKQLLRAGFACPRKAAVVYNGFDAEKFSRLGQRKNIRKSLNLKKEFVCLTFGRTGVSKGIEFAAAAVPRVRVPGYRHLFMLSGADNERISALLDSPESRGRVRRLIPVAAHEIPAYIRAADCVVIPSLAEGFGYAVVESCALGVPVVACRTTAIPEVIYGKHVLVRPADPQAIARGIESVWKGKWRSSGKKEFSIVRNISAYMAIYKRLANNGAA